VRQGRFLPPGDPRRGAAVVVLGPRLKRELFGEANVLGEHVRIGGTRFLVIGVMAPKGQFLGIDLDDSAYVPVSRALTLFNRDELHEIDVLFTSESVTDSVVAGIRKALMDRHDGEEDFSVITQSGMLDVLDRVLRMVSIAVSGIAAISLLVGAIGILTMMWISVNERTSEIGLLKALGATSRQVLALYLAEAGLLSLIGGAIGVGLGLGLARALQWAVRGLPVHTPMPFVVAALGVSLAVGLLSGVLPARRAAALDPLEALRAE
jgi:putative ABC transport system permease protein